MRIVKKPRNYCQYLLREFHEQCKEKFIDLSDYESVEKIVRETQPDVIIHMATVSRVHIAKNNPRHTYNLPLMGL